MFINYLLFGMFIPSHSNNGILYTLPNRLADPDIFLKKNNSINHVH